MARIKRMGEVYSAGDVKVTVAGIYDFDPTAISYGYKYAHEYQRGLKRKPRGWRMGAIEYEASMTIALDIVAELEKMFGDIALIRPFPINVTYANTENEMIHDTIWVKFTGNKRSVTNEGELENEFELFVTDMTLNIIKKTMTKEIEKQELPAGITEAMIADAKTKHGSDKVRILSIPIDDDATAYKDVLAIVPTRRIIGMYQRFSDKDPDKAQEILVKNCLLSHKDEIIADDGLFFGALNLLAKLIPVREGIIKNC